MAERSKSQRRADAAYEKNSRRGVSVTLRLTDPQADWLRQQQQPGESRPDAIRRMCRMPYDNM